MNNISNSKDKIMSYLNEKGKKSLSITKNENLSHRIKTKTNTNSNNNLLENKVEIHFHYPKSSISYNNTINKNNFASSAKQLSESYSLLNKKNNLFQSNIALYNKNININFLDKYLKTNQSRKNNNNINNLAKKPLFIHSIDFSSNNNFHKNKKIISTTTRQSPRKSFNNFNSISSRVNKVLAKNILSNRVVKNIKSNSCENNYYLNTNLKSTSIDKNIESNLNNMKLRIKKIISHSQKEIDTKTNFHKKYTSNNSPNKTNNYFNSEENSDKKQKEYKNPLLKKTIKRENLNNKISQIINLLNNKNNINKLQKGNLLKNTFNTKANLTESTSNFNGNSFLSDSLKLSSYIKTYYKKNNNNYPETLISFYKYGRIIGQGAFGKVNLGLNVLTGRVVAIKSFNKSNLNSNSENMKKIVYETNLMKKLNHPNITKILELFEEKEYILIIMEYINGGNLFSFLKKHRTVSEKTAKLLYKQIILGIKYMHEQNIVHRDIKLENILIDLNNNIKICDFGIGRVLSSPDQPLFDQCGTPMYIAPEILLCSKDKGYKGFPVDIWSSGIVLYILLSGTLPFSFKNTSESLMGSKESKIEEDNNNSLELQYSIVNNEPKEIENLSNEGKDLLRKILQKDPKKRITCEEILNHPWMKGISNNEINSNKYHLFTKAEINILSKTYVDYRKDKNDNLKEAFTLANLFIEEENNNSKLKEYKNEETKSSILAPFNSVNKSDEEEDIYNDEIIMDDFINNKIRLENGIIIIGNKVKEFNMLYELNNNCEVDNGIIINSRTNTISSKSDNNSIYINNEIKDTDGFIDKNEKIKDNKKNEEEIEKILNEIELLGYDKKYVKECVDKNILCHASAAYYLMISYDNI